MMTDGLICTALRPPCGYPGRPLREPTICPSFSTVNVVQPATALGSSIASNELFRRPGSITAIATLNLLGGVFWILLGGFWLFGTQIRSLSDSQRLDFFVLAVIFGALGSTQTVAGMGATSRIVAL